MTTSFATAHSQFAQAIAKAKFADAAFEALQTLTRALVPAKLFTVMTVDMAAELARRAYSSDPANYPVSGTKPITYNSWFDIVHKERRTFVANTIEAIAEVFPDYELIDSLGCQSVVNLPVIVGDTLIATMNILDVAESYTPERVALIEAELSVPAMLACLVAERTRNATP